jgi:HD-like signal output (HDOD) protein
VLSDLLARRAAISRAEAEEAFVIGILHPIGRALLIQHFPVEYNQVIAQAKAQKTNTEHQERKVFSIDNHAIGLNMVDKWKLPPNVADGILFQNKPHKSSLRSTRVLGIAVHHIKMNRIGFCGDSIPHPISDEVYESLSLTRAGVSALVEDGLAAELAKAEDFIKGV